MSKRQLGSRYKDLVDYIENEDESLTDFLTEAIEEGYAFHNRNNKLWRILEDLYTTPLVDFEFGDLTKTIVDIFEDNYELEEPECYWKLNIEGLIGSKYYAFKYVDTIHIGIDSNKDVADKFTKSELIKSLNNTDTNLTIDNFEPVEEIEND